jgi:hypothetical protein
MIQNNINSQEGISLGIKGGFGYSQYFFQYPTQNQLNLDFNYIKVIQKGIVLGYRDNKNWGTHLEIMLTQKAWEEEFPSSYKKRVTIEYLEFPILSSYKIGKKKSSLIIVAGMYLATGLNMDSVNSGQLMEGDSTIVPYQDFSYKKFDYGIKGGLAYQYMFGRNILQLEIMYSQGLQNLFGRDYFAIYRSLNQGLYANLVYKIAIRGKQNSKIEKPPIK